MQKYFLCRITGFLIWFSALVFTVTLVVGAPPVSAQVPATAGVSAPYLKTGVRLQDALAYTYANNTDILAARAQYLAVKEQLPQAEGGYKPTVFSSVTVLASDSDKVAPGGADGSVSKAADVSFSQPLYRGGRTVAAVNAAKDIIAAQDAFVSVTVQGAMLQAVTAFMDVLRDSEIVLVTKNNLGVLNTQREATLARFDVGELTRTDTAQAEARVSAAQAGLMAARGRLNASQAVFAEVIGLSSDGLAFPDGLPPVPDNAEMAAQTAEESSPAVLAAIKSESAAKHDVDQAFGALLPEVGAFGALEYARDPQPGILDSQRNGSIGVKATIPLYQAGVVKSRVRAAEHTAKQREIEVRDVKRAVRQNVVSAWARWRAAQAEIAARAAQLDAAKVAREGVQQENLYGTRTVLDALNADQEVLDAHVALIGARRDEVVARYTLLGAMGQIPVPADGGGFMPAVDASQKNGAVVFPQVSQTHPSVQIFDLGVDDRR